LQRGMCIRGVRFSRFGNLPRFWLFYIDTRLFW
jgi:hypothetical protein